MKCTSGLASEPEIPIAIGQSYRMTNIDAMGYNARTTDPLYKHIPFYLTWKKKSKVAIRSILRHRC